MFGHELLALVVGQLVPVLADVAPLGHRVEAPGPLVRRGQLRAQAHLGHLRRQAQRVLRQLGDRHVAVSDLKPGTDQPGLQVAQHPGVGVQAHEAQLRPVAQHGHCHHLRPRLGGLLHRAEHRSVVAAGRAGAEQMHDHQSVAHSHRFVHHRSVRSLNDHQPCGPDRLARSTLRTRQPPSGTVLIRGSCLFVASPEPPPSTSRNCSRRCSGVVARGLSTRIRPAGPRCS